MMRTLLTIVAIFVGIWAFLLTCWVGELIGEHFGLLQGGGAALAFMTILISVIIGSIIAEDTCR